MENIEEIENIENSELSKTNENENEDIETVVVEYTDEELCAALEAVLFASGESLSIDQLVDILGVEKNLVHTLIERLKDEYSRSERGIMITELEDSVQLGTKGDYFDFLMKLAKHPKRYHLTDSVIETLSIVAYKQPVTRGEIEKIRGVSSDHAVNKLLEFDLIEEVGRLDAPGKPILFGTTEQFLRSFGVRSVNDLPTISPEVLADFKQQAESEASGAGNIDPNGDGNGEGDDEATVNVDV